MLQATLVDTWASTAAGAFALSENNLYTTEAFVDYLSHLTHDGVMSFTRWGFDPPRESLRVVALARAALERLGEHDPARHVAVIREHLQQLKGWGAQDTILVSRRAFSDADIALLKKSAEIAKIEVVYLPGTSFDTPFRTLLETNDPEKFFESYPFDVRPVSDNRPFFFYTVQPRDLWHFVMHASRATADYKVNNALPVLFGLVAISIVATIVILSLPPIVLRTALPSSPGGQTRIAVLSFHRCRLHPDSGGADTEIRFVPRASNLCADRHHFLDAALERIGKLRQQTRNRPHD